jgi:hypothetical protein
MAGNTNDMLFHSLRSLDTVKDAAFAYRAFAAPRLRTGPLISSALALLS